MRLTVNVLFEHEPNGNAHGCSYVRLLRPLSHPSLKKLVHLNSSNQLAQGRADVVIVERWWKPDICEQDAIDLVAEVRRRGSVFIYTLDDNLLDLGLDEEGDDVAENKLRATRYFVREADGVIVSTPALEKRLAMLNPNVVVVPNALDERLFQPQNRDISQGSLNTRIVDSTDETIRIGYMGTKTHIYDLQMIAEPLRKLLFRYGDRVKFEIIGISQDHERITRMFGSSVQFLEPINGHNYEKFVDWYCTNIRWDIGLTPLSEREFNRYKSDIKLLDYGIVGIPGIFSNFGPYPETITQGVNGVLVKNDPNEWFDTLEKMVCDHEFRQCIGMQAFEYVVKERTLRTSAIDWFQAIEKIYRKNSD